LVKQKNTFRSDRDYAYIGLSDKQGITVAEAIIQVADLERVLSLGRWRRLGNGYVATTQFANGKRKEVYLHRFLTGALRGETVDHINGNPLDNRVANLRIVRHAENMQNQRRRVDSTTGVRNVSYVASDGRFKVVIRGRFFGRFTSFAEAVRIAEMNRSRVMPFATVGI
jgi:hypothetical protein